MVPRGRSRNSEGGGPDTIAHVACMKILKPRVFYIQPRPFSIARDYSEGARTSGESVLLAYWQGLLLP